MNNKVKRINKMKAIFLNLNLLTMYSSDSKEIIIFVINSRGVPKCLHIDE